MIQFDETYYPELQKTMKVSEKRDAVRHSIVLALGASYPCPLPLGDIVNLYTRYFTHRRQVDLYDGLIALLEKMADDKLIVFQYHREKLSAVGLKKSQETKNMLNLPPCLAPLKACYASSCAHHVSCHIYLESVLRLEKRKKDTAGRRSRQEVFE
ncbi:MAG: hypothetical protein IH600_16480 [Bacteroidetes bacterium]|nr:hypothetical protein [Bacteroidota bacterium]